MNIAILLYKDVDLLDSGGPYEVFLTASRLLARDGSNNRFEVRTVSLDGHAVTSYGGMGLVPHTSIDDAMNSDVLIVPGTIDIELAIANNELVQAICAFANQTDNEKIVASVCTGAFLLAQAGLINGSNWTTHFEDIDLMAERFNLELGQKNTRWVDSGTVVTAAGLSSGIDMALHLVKRFYGNDLAERTAKQIEYNWIRA